MFSSKKDRFCETQTRYRAVDRRSDAQRSRRQCLLRGGGTKATTEATGDPVPGGTLIFGTAADPICVDPNQTDLTATRDILRQVADSLVDADPETGEIVPWLATAWEVNDNATVFDFTLRTDVTFSNGEVFDAAAVKTFIDGIRDLGGRAVNASSYLGGYVGTEVVAPDRARVTFDTPNASFLQALSTVNMAVLSPSTYQVAPEQRCSVTSPHPVRSCSTTTRRLRKWC